MQLTVQVKLLASEQQAKLLKETLKSANAACDWISQRAWEKQVFAQLPLHKLVYYPCREAFPKLASQVVVRANAKVVDSYKLDCKVARKFRPLGSFPYDERLLSWNMEQGTVSLWSVNGRLKLPFICGERQQAMLQHERGQADLVFREGTFYLFVSVSLPETKQPKCEDWLGIDLGIANIAADSDGRTYGNAKKVSGLRERRFRQRKRLQSRCTRSAKRVLRRLSGRESRFVRQTNHEISKQIVAEAKRTGRGIALEDLTYIRARIRATKSQRRRLHSWAFADLQAKIAYKSRLIGVPVRFVDPRNSSRTCPSCGQIAKANRKTRDTFACISCGFTADADTNAARELSRRAVIIQPHERASVSLGDAYVQNLPLRMG